MTTILLTGAGGFAGSHLKKYLGGRGFNLICPQSSAFDFEDAAAVKELLKKHYFDFVIHCGFYGIKDPKNIPSDIKEKNLKIFNNLAQNLAPKAFMFNMGSGAEYDKSRPLVNITEADFGKQLPKDDYGLAKYAISEEIKKYPNIYNLRIFGLYGEGEGPQRFINYAINQNIKKEPVLMRQNVIFSYLYIEDFCALVYEFLKTPPKNRFINMAPPKPIDLITLTKLINKAGGYQSALKIEQAGLNKEYSASPALLQGELPSFTFHTYEEAIHKYYAILSKGAANGV